MPFSWVKGSVKVVNLGNVFAVRLKRLTKNGRKQRSSTTTYHEGDHSIPAYIPMQPSSLTTDPGLQVSTNVTVSSATSSQVESSARTASDMAQTFLPVVRAAAAAIPVAGPPLQAAIGVLLSILQTIDTRNQNKADLDHLASRLHRLSSHLWNAPNTQDSFEQYRRDSMIRMLEDTSAQVTQLRDRSLAYASVAQDIVGCSSKIDSYLADYSWSSQMHTRNDIHEIQKTLVRYEEILMSFGIPGQSSVGPIVTLGFVTLVDATNRSHTIPMDVCDSFERFNEQLQLLFKRNTIQAQIQRQYMEQGQYDLCIDDDKQVILLTSREWPSIEAGTKIVMRVVFEQQTSFRVDYRCHFCGAVNDVGVGSIVDSLQRQAGCSINCRQCKRRFQISRPRSSAKQSTQSSVPRTEAEMHIRNFHIQQTDDGRAAGSHGMMEMLRQQQELAKTLQQQQMKTLAMMERLRAASEQNPNFNAGGASAHSYESEFLGDGPMISPNQVTFHPHDAEYGHSPQPHRRDQERH